jgi:hypothetical protein
VCAVAAGGELGTIAALVACGGALGVEAVLGAEGALGVEGALGAGCGSSAKGDVACVTCAGATGAKGVSVGAFVGVCVAAKDSQPFEEVDGVVDRSTGGGSDDA